MIIIWIDFIALAEKIDSKFQLIQIFINWLSVVCEPSTCQSIVCHNCQNIDAIAWNIIKIEGMANIFSLSLVLIGLYVPE